ncbi:hypothetical protein NQ318_017851 [Aromia moschata]|uniref:Maturase K n=1 Tax=Aromia moschata TaxID=1265417 RepID=A0AAV8XR79_9CUCU|nr:hypothetical protein NQ318_017851 [Aromia moschata]
MCKISNFRDQTRRDSQSVEISRDPEIFEIMRFLEIPRFLENARFLEIPRFLKIPRFLDILKFLEKGKSRYLEKSRNLEKSRLTESFVSRIEISHMPRLTSEVVPGHKGVEGNEEANTLVRKSSATTLIGPEPMCGIVLLKLCNEEDETAPHINRVPSTNTLEIRSPGNRKPPGGLSKEKSCEKATKPYKGNRPIHMK